MARSGAVQRAFDELYSIEPAAFVARRKALAEALRRDGDTAGAAAVKAAKKPTVSAALVNRLVRAEPRLVDALVLATTEVVRAQLGAKGRTYQEALVERRAAEDRVSEALHALGASEAVVHRAMASLRAGSLTAETREALRAGHLHEDLEMPDVDVLLEGLPAPKRRTAPRPDRGAAERARQESERAAKARIAETKRALDAARARLEAAERERAAAQRELAAAEEAHGRARRAR
jgi:hypothetical protein